MQSTGTPAAMRNICLHCECKDREVERETGRIRIVQSYQCRMNLKYTDV